MTLTLRSTPRSASRESTPRWKNDARKPPRIRFRKPAHTVNLVDPASANPASSRPALSYGVLISSKSPAAPPEVQLRLRVGGAGDETKVIVAASCSESDVEVLSVAAHSCYEGCRSSNSRLLEDLVLVRIAENRKSPLLARSINVVLADVDDDHRLSAGD